VPPITAELIMSLNRVRTFRRLAAAAIAATAVTGAVLAASTAEAGPGAAMPPPTHAGFDYQIGGAYTPPSGVRVVTRDHTANPASGLYNICYVNAFQAQPDAQGEWDADLLLRDANGKVVMDEDWGEALLDLRTDAKRRRVAAKVNGWIDGCAAKGYQGVEPDNYDSFSRSHQLVTTDHAQAYIRLLSAHAHTKGLAIAQKNTPELAGNRQQNGLDFAVAEECGQYDECGDYTGSFGDNVIVIEYTRNGLSKACAGWGSRLSIVQRDVGVSPVGNGKYVRRTC
jgi:hypothetical protein